MKPTYIVFDTETTGLPIYRDKITGETVPADDPRQPRIASFAYCFADEFGIAMSAGKMLVKPCGWSMAEFDARAIAEGKTPASEINGLTDEKLAAEGAPIEAVLNIWTNAIEDGVIAAAFNAQFDCKMMRAELRRAGRPDLFDQTRNLCMMRSLDPYGYEGLCIQRGFVKLAEACAFFGITNDNPHDAGADTEAARAILERLIADGRLPEAKVHYAKQRETV